MGYIGKTPTLAPLTASDITDGIITSDKLASDAVTSAKITDGTVAQADISDQAINEAKLQVSNAPTNGYMLTAQSGNTGGMTWAEAGSGSLVHIATTVVSSATGYVNFNNCFSTDYDVYRCHWSNFYNHSDSNQRIVAYLTDSSGSHLGANQMETVHGIATANSGSDGQGSGRGWGINYIKLTEAVNHTGVPGSGHIDLANPRDSSNRVTWNGQSFCHNGVHHYSHHYAGTMANTVEVFGISFSVTGGSIKADSTFSVYGYTKS